MQDISGTGISIFIKAEPTLPLGFTLSLFADDADPIDLPSLEIASAAMNINGELVTWSSPQPINPTINVLAGSVDDENLSSIMEANRAANGRVIARDVITMVVNYPDGSTVTLSNGKMTSGFPGKSVASAGRMKSKAYSFMFQDLALTRAQ